MVPLYASVEEPIWKKVVFRIICLDQTLLLSVRRWESAAMTRAMRAFTRLGDATTWVVGGLVLLAAGGPGLRYGLLLGSGAFLAIAISHLLKRVCRRSRPNRGIVGFVALAEDPDSFSFPSGHTAVAFGIAIALIGQGSWLGALTLTLAWCIAVSRVYLGAHYPLDVVAGVLIGIFSGLAARLLYWAG